MNPGLGAVPGGSGQGLRHDAFTPERQAQFLHVLSVCGSVRRAAASVGVSATAAYLCRRRSAHFAAGWDAALVLARDHAEQVLADRALDGVEEPVFYRGEEIGFRRRFDARLLLAHLARLDRRCGDRLAAARAARFDEMLVHLADSPSAPVPADPPRPGTDPFLPPTRREHVAEATEGLGPRAYPRERRRAEAEWDARQARARARVDALLRPLPGLLRESGGGVGAGPGASAFQDSVNFANFASAGRTGPEPGAGAAAGRARATG